MLCSSALPISLAPSSTLEIASSRKNSVIIWTGSLFSPSSGIFAVLFWFKDKVVVFFAWYSCLHQRSDTDKKLQSWFPSPTFSQSAARTESVTKVVLNPLLWLVRFYSLFTLEAIYATQEQRTFIQRQGENPREDKVSIDASHMALVAMASSATALEYGVFSCKVGHIQVHCYSARWKITDLSHFFTKISAHKFSGGEWVAKVTEKLINSKSTKLGYTTC